MLNPAVHKITTGFSRVRVFFFVTFCDLRPYFRSDLLLKGGILYELFISQSSFYSPSSNLYVIVLTADEKYAVDPQIKQVYVVSSQILFSLTLVS
jgi:hypothetical protein